MLVRFFVLLACALALVTPALAAAPRHVIVIVMENTDAAKVSDHSRSYIYGNVEDAPFLNNVLAPQSATAGNFENELTAYKSQPHYIVMEAGTNTFPDARFTCDHAPEQQCNSFTPNWTRSKEHLTTQIEAAGLTWMTYQEDIDPETTGACPIRYAGNYVAHHNPFIYFADVAGAPPTKDNANCIAHTRELGHFLTDMQQGSLANYVFISPNRCHDMHGHSGCPDNKIAAGDDFLKSLLTPLLPWARQNDAVVFVMWDEGSRSPKMPFFAAGAGVRQGHQSDVSYSHRSVLRTVERIFGLPVLPAVSDATDLSDMFEPGVLP